MAEVPRGANEQLLLELMNRARLDPLAEAARHGIDLNEDLAPGRISAAPKPALAKDVILNAAATAHSQWMRRRGKSCSPSAPG